MKRLFAAIKIKPEENFHEIYHKLKKQLHHEQIKWVDLQNMHITLKFFGETPEEKIPEIVSVLEKIKLQTIAFSIQVNNVGIFGSSYKPRVIWFGIEQCDKLLRLGLNTLKEVEMIGFERDRQNFRSHLTIGRIKNIDNKKRFNEVIHAYKDAEIQSCEVDEMHLYESILLPLGPNYRVIKSFQFTKKPA